MSQSTHPLFHSFNLGENTLSSRIVMAPLTRRRADMDTLAANDLIAKYYRQRATAGLIIAEGTLISCGGHGHDSARRMIDSGDADLVAFGKPFISNPDLVRRLQEGLPIAEPDKDTFYHGGPKGYIDYPEYPL